MKQRTRRPALDLIEEAVHLLRRASGTAFAWYYLGAVPFVLSVLYFWTDMSWSVDARRDCALDSTVVAALFCWMKFCQAMFADELRKRVSLDPWQRQSLRAMLRIFVQQAVFQPSKLFILPIALLITFPFGWLCAFYENLTVFGSAPKLGDLQAKAWRQATLWPRENHLALLIISLLRIVMAINLLLVLLILPRLLHTLTGFENIFTRSSMHVLNSTALVVILAGTYLSCDPLLKAFYVLRCFYGESLQSGEDLQVELRRFRRMPALAIAAIMALFLSLGALASAPPDQSTPLAVRADELDRSIKETMDEPKFRWRSPREETQSAPNKESRVERWFRNFYHTMKRWGRSFKDWLDRLGRTQRFSESKQVSTGDASRKALEIALIVFVVALFAMLGWKIRQYFASNRLIVPKTRKGSPVDLTNEAVRAEELPEDEWLRLAHELIAGGDLALALRALFFAGMAHLAHRQVIILARHKSNRDYLLELRRRVPSDRELQNAFAENRLAVERAWYGRHEVDDGVLKQFQQNLSRIQAA